MDWAEVSVVTKREAADVVSSLLTDEGAGGVVVDDVALVNEYIRSKRWDYTDIPEREETGCVTLVAYFPYDGTLDERLSGIRRGLGVMSENGTDTAPSKISVRRVRDEDWENGWKKFFHTERVGERIVIQPSWEEYLPKSHDVVIRLDPGAAFGTGTHPTTSMCLTALERLIRPGMTVFDVGTGSGILAIAAAKLGAMNVTAADYDETALKVARANISASDENITVARCDLLKGFSGRADIITANLVADLVIRMMPELGEHLAPDGTLVASGIIRERGADVREAVTANGFHVWREEERGGWLAMLIRQGQR